MADSIQKKQQNCNAYIALKNKLTPIKSSSKLYLLCHL